MKQDQPHDKRLLGTATVGTKGQVVIPAEARETLDIKPGDKLYVIGSEQRKWIGFIKEEQFREFLEHITSNIESYKSALEHVKNEANEKE